MNRIALLLPLAACLVHAQSATSPEAGRARPLSPILLALDKDRDGVISAVEIANASAALKTLDQNGDGKLSPDEYRPPRPDGSTSGSDASRVEGQGRRPNREGNEGPNASAANSGTQPPLERDGAKPEDRGGFQNDRPKRPRPPLDTVLDEDGDEIISAAEIAKAPTLLKKLDLNGDGKLSRDEYAPKPAMQREGQNRNK